MDLVARLTARCTNLEKDLQISLDKQQNLHQELANQLVKFQSMILEAEKARDLACLKLETVEREFSEAKKQHNLQIDSLNQAIDQLKMQLSQKNEQLSNQCKRIAMDSCNVLQDEKDDKSREEVLEKTIESLKQQLENTKAEPVYVLRLFPERNPTEPPPSKLYLSSSSTKPDSNNFQEQISTLERRLERFKQVFKQKIKEFREVVLCLLGWQIDLLPNGGCRMLSLYAFGQEDYLEFEPVSENTTKSGEETIKLRLVPEKGKILQQFRNERELYVQMGNSIPAFMAFLTTNLWERSTIS